MNFPAAILATTHPVTVTFAVRLLFYLTIHKRDFPPDSTTEQKVERLMAFSELCHRILPSLNCPKNWTGKWDITRKLLRYCKHWHCEGLAAKAWEDVTRKREFADEC